MHVFRPLLFLNDFREMEIIISKFCQILFKNDGFKNPSLKINGFHGRYSSKPVPMTKKNKWSGNFHFSQIWIYAIMGKCLISEKLRGFLS